MPRFGQGVSPDPLGKIDSPLGLAPPGLTQRKELQLENSMILKKKYMSYEKAADIAIALTVVAICILGYLYGG